MARNGKQLSNAFQQYSKQEKKDVETMPAVKEVENITGTKNTVTDNINNEQLPIQKTEQENKIINSNNNTVTDNVTVLSNIVNVTSDVTNNQEVLSIEQVKNEFLSMFEEKNKKETMENTHTRTTFLFRKDLAKRLDKLAKNKRGFKTMFINKAIEALLDEMEKH
jgi:hypothetical protein